MNETQTEQVVRGRFRRDPLKEAEAAAARARAELDAERKRRVEAELLARAARARAQALAAWRSEVVAASPWKRRQMIKQVRSA